MAAVGSVSREGAEILGDFVDRVSTPSLVIPIEAPDDVCIIRQRECDRISVTKSWITSPNQGQQLNRDVWQDVLDVPPERSRVVSLDGTDPLEENVAFFDSVLFQEFPEMYIIGQ